MQWRRILVPLAAAAAAGSALVACGGSADDGARTSVVAAFYPLAFAAERIAPEAEVTNLTPTGAEPHDLELSPRDVERIQAADLVLYVGGGFMPAVEDAVDDHGNALDLGGGGDPHTWLNPMLLAGMAQSAAIALGGLDAANDLVLELEELDREYRDGLADCERREIVTSHAAFGHLAAAYDLVQVPLTGSSPEAEPSAHGIEALAQEVERSGATTVFVEPLVSPRLAETIARAAGVDTAVLDPLEGLTSEQAEAGADYFSVMRANLAALRKALACT